MRPRLGMAASAMLDELSRLEGRSAAQTLRIAISERLRERRGNTGVQPDPRIDADATARGAFIATRIKPAMRHDIHVFAEREQRSISNALRRLIADGLRSNGITPAPAPTADAQS